MPGAASSSTGRAPRARLPVPHRLQPRAGDPRGSAALRRKHEDVRRIAPGAGLERRAYRGDARPRLSGIVQLPTIEDAVKAGGFLGGRPEDIIEALEAVEKRYPGLDRVICATPLGTPLDVQLADLDRFAKEVIPAFRDTPTAAAAQ